MLKTEWRNGLVALILGAAFPLGFAPLGWWPLSLLSAAGLFLILNTARGGLLWLAWIYGLGKYLSGASWIYVSINEYGNASMLLAAPWCWYLLPRSLYLCCRWVGRCGVLGSQLLG